MNELYHHGIKGQRWGVRRFQNEDGSLTPEGMERYGVDDDGNMSDEGRKRYEKDSKKYRVENYHHAKRANANLSKEEREEAIKKSFSSEEEYEQAKQEYRKHQGTKATAIALGSVGAVAAHALVAGAIIGGHNIKKNEANKFYNNQIQRTISIGQGYTDRLVDLQNQEKGLKESRKNLITGSTANTVQDYYHGLKTNGGEEYDSFWKNNKDSTRALQVFNGTDYTNASKAKTVQSAIESNRREQSYNQQRIAETKETLQTMLMPEVKSNMVSDAYKNYRLIKKMNKSMTHSGWVIADDNYLCHHGIKGQKWGIRRFQNEDGSLTPEGMKRYGVDSNGNMSKKGAANYYRDIYNNSKSSGKRGQDLHDDVRNKFGSDEEYRAFAKNYKNYKLKKAAIGVGAGVAGAAATGLGIYGITRAAKAGQDRRLVNKYGDKFATADMNELIRINKEGRIGARTFNTQKMREEAALDSRVAGALARQQLKTGDKRWSSMLKEARKNGGNGLDYNAIAENNIDRAKTMATGTALERAYKKSVEKRAGAAAKESLRETRKEMLGNLKIASLNQAKTNAGKEATANMVNSFSNSLIGKVTTGAGTLAGGAVLGAAALGGKKIVSSMIDEQAGNNMFGGNYSKETKDKASSLTQPVSIDQAWKDRNKKKKKDEDDDD